MILAFRPVLNRPPSWIAADAARPSSPFSAPYSDTLEVLDRELTALDADDAFLQVVLGSDRDLRLDGQLRSDAKVQHPGVILTVESSSRGTLTFGTDRFTDRPAHEAWKANLRAIALGLEALRKVDRYGIAEQGQQYAGYRELGSGPAIVPMTAEAAARLLAEHAFPDLEGPELEAAVAGVVTDPQVAYRLAARATHPDAGGSAELFRLVGSAREVIERTRTKGGPR